MSETHRSIVLVANPASGRGAHTLDAIRSCLEKECVHVLETLSIEELDRLHYWIGTTVGERPLVVAAGGDGTVGSVASYVVDTETIFGILPVGTSNDIARSLQIPLKIEDAVHVLTDGAISLVDVGRFQAEGEEPRYFLHAATAGINVAFAKMATQRSFRKRLGKFTYLVAGLAALRQAEPFTCDVEVDGRRISMSLLQLGIVNAPVFGGLLHLELPQSSTDDHRLDVLAIEHMPIRRIILRALSVLLGRDGPVQGMRLYHVQEISVYPRQSQSVTLDGEIAATIPGSFSLRAEGLHVLRPRTQR